MRRALYAPIAAIVLVGIIGKRWIPLWDYVFGGASEAMRDVVG